MNSLYFPLLSCIGIVIHLMAEIASLIKIQKQEKCINIKRENPLPAPSSLQIVLRNMFASLTASSIISFCLCTAITKKLAFCSNFAQHNLKCLIEEDSENGVTARMLQLAINPVYFPLTINAVIPILITMATRQTLFKQPSILYNKSIPSWMLFVCVYSLFIFDLIIFSQTEIFVENYFVLPEPLQWRNLVGSIIRNVIVICVTFCL